MFKYRPQSDILYKRGLKRQHLLTSLGLCLALMAPLSPAFAQTEDPPSAPPTDSIEIDPNPDSQTPPAAIADTLPNLQMSPLFNSPFQQQNFVPNISLIMDSSVGGRNFSNEDFGRMLQPLNLQQEADVAALPTNGLNFNYAELAMGSPVDPYLDLFAVFHLHPEGFEVEEAYALTRGLPFDLQLKAGKFLSHFGRINPQHAHFWSFNDAPVIYSEFFGGEDLNEQGIRLSWLAPTDFYLDLGLEALKGENERSFGTTGFTVGDQTVPGINLPNLLVGTVKTSFDLLDNLVLLGGLSYAQGGTRIAGEAGGDATTAQATLPEGLENFAGMSQIGGADLSLRWFIDSYRELSWQSEFLFRHTGGSVYDAVGTSPLDKYQSGLYSQLVWRFAQRWSTGVRLDLLTQNQTVADGISSAGAAMLPRYTAMLEFKPSDFTRFRLQYNLDQTHFLDGENPLLHELFLQMNLVIGAHGAHNF